MMNLYGDDRYVYGNESRYKPTFMDRLSNVLGYINPVYYVESLKRKHDVKKIEKAIAQVQVEDTAALKKIYEAISGAELETAVYGKPISKSSLDNFIAKIIMNGNNIISEKDINYYLEIAPKHNEEIYQARKENSLLGKIGAKIDDIKNSRSVWARKITKEIELVDANDTDKLKEIYGIMVSHDFDSTQFGKMLSDKTIKTFVDKVEENDDKIVDEKSMSFIKKQYNIQNENHEDKEF